MFDAQWEPQILPATIAVVSFAVLYLWYVLSVSTIGDRVFAYPREHWGSLWNCPWCAGFWLTGMALFTIGAYDPLTHLATAGLVGLLGTHSG